MACHDQRAAPSCHAQRAKRASGISLPAVLLVALLGLGCGRDDDDGSAAAPVTAPDTANDDGGNLTPPETPLEQSGGNTAVAEFRGIVATDALLHERLLVDANYQFFLGNYLGGYSSEYLYGLPLLLGYSQGDGLNSEFRNGHANAINMVLWNLSFVSLGEDIAKHCLADDAAATRLFDLQDSFAGVLQPLCSWPAEEARSSEAVSAFWRAVMVNDAPAVEETAFVHFFLSDAYLDATPAETIRDMTVAAMMNPYFLIKP